MTYKYKTRVRIYKPVEECFEAVRDPKILCKYFTYASTGPLEAGQLVTWSWQSGCENIQVKVLDSAKDQYISCLWQSHEISNNVPFIFRFESENEGSCLVSVEEGSWPNSQAGVDQSYECCAGWTDMLISLKMWLEYKIDTGKSPEQQEKII